MDMGYLIMADAKGYPPGLIAEKVIFVKQNHAPLRRRQMDIETALERVFPHR